MLAIKPLKENLSNDGTYFVYSQFKEIRRQYVQARTNAFPHAHVMMRRPFAEAKEYNLELFNDMAGHPQSTYQWLDWIKRTL